MLKIKEQNLLLSISILFFVFSLVWYVFAFLSNMYIYEVVSFIFFCGSLTILIIMLFSLDNKNLK